MVKNNQTPNISPDISYETFLSVDIRSGTIIKAAEYPEARNPSLKVWVDFGAELGVLQSSAQITVHYMPEELVGRKVMGCVNLGEKQIGKFMSQFLLLGFTDENGAILLAGLEPQTPNGQKLL